MADYKEVTKQVNISGVEKSWRRCRLVTIKNDYGQIPKIEFLEDNVTITADGREIHKGGETLKLSFNPEDAKHVELYTRLYELYMELATFRDEKLLLNNKR
jgi:hypothetical protein